MRRIQTPLQWTAPLLVQRLYDYPLLIILYAAIGGQSGGVVGRLREQLANATSAPGKSSVASGFASLFKKKG